MTMFRSLLTKALKTVADEKSLKQDEFRKSERYTDMRIRLNDGKIYPAHKLILITGCPYFERMFNSEMKETYQDIIDIKLDITDEHFDLLLTYIYTGQVPFNDENGTVMYEHSVFLELDKLRKLSETHLMLTINKSPELCLDIWRLSKKYDHNPMEVRCKEYIADFTTNFFDNCIQYLTFAELIEILDIRKKLSCTYQFLFTKLIEWLKMDYETKKCHIKELFAFIDFQEMPIDYVFSTIFEDLVIGYNKDFYNLLSPRYRREIKSYERSVNYPKQQKIFIVHVNGILKFSLDLIIPECVLHNRQFKLTSAYTSFNNSNSILVSGGKNEIYCGYYFNTKKEWRRFPQLPVKRHMHEGISINEKIYLCGGRTPNNHFKLMDIYDFESDKWLTAIGPNEKNIDFGMVNIIDCQSIYTFGGYSARPTITNIVERYDPREGQWFNINRNSARLGFTKSIAINDQIYCFSEYGYYVFDIKTNSWTNDGGIHENNAWWRRFHIAKLDDSIYIFGWKGFQNVLPIRNRYVLSDYGTIERCDPIYIDHNFPYKKICYMAALND